jgi:ABC-type multidrug transport system permease subunit
MVSNARVLLLDEPTTGLDAAVARDIMVVLRDWCEVSGGTVISALLQPTPECYELYDDLILLKEGEIVYHGPRVDMEQFMEHHWGLIAPPEMDIADFIIEVLTNPKEQFDKQQHRIKKGTLKRKFSLQERNILEKIQLQQGRNDQVTFHFEKINSDTVVEEKDNDPTPLLARTQQAWPISNAQLLAAYKQSRYYEYQLSAVAAVESARSVKLSNLAQIKQHHSPYTLAQYGQLYTRGFVGHTGAALKRQFLLLGRDKQTVPPRAFSAIFQALIFGSLFYRLATEDFYSKLGILLFSLMFFAMGNFTELPATFEGRNAVYKHVNAGMYPTISYIIAMTIASFPIIILESFLYCIPLYFMVGLAAEAGRFFFFWLFLMLIDVFFASLFRTICYKVVSVDVAQQVAMPFMNIAMIYSGFLILKNEIRNWQIGRKRFIEHS